MPTGALCSAASLLQTLVISESTQRTKTSDVLPSVGPPTGDPGLTAKRSHDAPRAEAPGSDTGAGRKKWSAAERDYAVVQKARERAAHRPVLRRSREEAATRQQSVRSRGAAVREYEHRDRDQANPTSGGPWAVHFDDAVESDGRGNHSDAVRRLLKLAETGDHLPAVIGLLGGILYYDLRRADEALPYLRKSVFLSPMSEMASLALFHALMEKGEPDRAWDEAQRFLSLSRSESYRRLLDALDAPPASAPAELPQTKVVGAPEFIAFFEWAYQITIPGAARQFLTADLRRGTSADPKVMELVAYVVRQHHRVASVKNTPAERSLRTQAREIFRRQFENPEPNERGGVLRVLCGILEQIAPGCTGTSVVAPYPLST